LPYSRVGWLTDVYYVSLSYKISPPQHLVYFLYRELADFQTCIWRLLISHKSFDKPQHLTISQPLHLLWTLRLTNLHFSFPTLTPTLCHDVSHSFTFLESHLMLLLQTYMLNLFMKRSLINDVYIEAIHIYFKLILSSK
jgi:hypothetical protein